MPESAIPRTDWLRVLLLWVAGLGAAAQYGKVSVIFDRLPELYPEAGAALGWTVSLVGGVGIVLGITAGLVVGRLTPRSALIWALWLGAGISILQSFAPPLWLFLLSRLIEGASHLAIVVAAPTLIANLSSERDRGLTLTLWGTFFGVAFALLSWVGLPFVARHGVPSLFLAHGVFMALAGVSLAWVLPHEVPTGPRPRFPGLRALGARHLSIYRSPFLSAPAAGWLFYTFCFVSLLTLLPPYLDPGTRAFLIGAMPLVSIVTSMTLGVGMLRRISSIAVIQIGFLASAGCALALLAAPGSPVLCLAFAGALGLVQGASFAAVPDLNPASNDRLLANGAMAQTGNIGNTLGTPVIFALIGVFGHAGLMATLCLMLLSGAAAHAALHLARRAP